MLGRLFILFTLIPLVELYLLIKVGNYLGAEFTILLILITGGVGALMARAQGLRVLFQIRERLHEGLLPADEVLAGGLIVAAGLLLVTPGILTDAVGLALLFPFVRSRLAAWVKDFFRRKIEEGRIHIVTLEGEE